jgi:hypothetical protein
MVANSPHRPNGFFMEIIDRPLQFGIRHLPVANYLSQRARP